LAGVSVQGDTVSGDTDSNGVYSFKLATSGPYNLKFSKSGYGDKSLNIISKCKLEIQTSSSQASVGGSITAILYDENSDKIGGTLTVTAPDGTSTTSQGDTHAVTFDQGGEYTLKASKTDCVDKETKVVVRSKPATITAELDKDEIVITVESEGNPVPNVELKVTMPLGDETTVTTDDDGMAVVNAEEPGDYVIAMESAAYGDQEVTVTKSSFSIMSFWWVFVLLLLIIIVVAIALGAGVYLKKKPKESFKKRPSSRLGG
jgi:hypothetical protein